MKINSLASLLVLGLFLLLLAVTLGSWWLGRRFWKQSSAPVLMGSASYRTFAQRVLLASLLNLLLYCVTAVFLLPWSQGAAHGRSPSPNDWQEAHFTHECWLLVLSGVGGALTLLVRGRRTAALSWLTGCVLVIAGFRGQRIYRDQVEERSQQVAAATPFLVNDSLGYAKMSSYYDSHGNVAEPSARLLRRAIPFDKIAVKPAFPGGEEALRVAIRQRLRYPWAAQGQEVPVDIAVECIVEPTGRLTVLYPSEAPIGCEDLGYEEEAVRVVRSLSYFVPGQRAGQAVAATYTVPIAFRPAASSSQHPR